ncbi:MAG: serine hydrolase domain-containing protein [Pseudomonadota bacterium]
MRWDNTKKGSTYSALALLLVGLVTQPVLASEGSEAWVGAFETGLRPALKLHAQPAQRWTIEERMAHHRVPGLSIAVIHGGEVIWARGYGSAKVDSDLKIDTETVFSVGSLSKTGTAASVLRLVSEGKLALDVDVNSYLESWKAPRPRSGRELTLRMLLSHTAGLNNHGFDDFQPSEDLPTTLEILQGNGPAKNRKVRLIHEPGETFDYSGGGTTVAGLVVEETFGKPFPDAAKALVFDLLGMNRTTFEVPLPPTKGNIAYAHDAKGELTALPRGYESFPETAASGLWTTPSEYGAMLSALWRAYAGIDESFISRDTAVEALTPVWPGSFGTGPSILDEPTGRRIQHTGANESYRAVYDVGLNDGEGIVVFTNGTNGHLLFPEIIRALADARDWQRLQEKTAVQPAANVMKHIAGSYRLDRRKDTFGAFPAADTPQSLSVSVIDEGIELRAIGSEDAAPQTLYPITPTTFMNSEGYVQVEFVRDATGKFIGLNYSRGYNYLLNDRKGLYTKEKS